jgi:peptidoglycan hydrolase-like protein with peptidoglycan-binding domain
MPYPGSVLRIGTTGESVLALQEYLNYISDTYRDIPKITVDGVYGEGTENAVRAFQRQFGLAESGIVSSRLWDYITSVYRDLYDGNSRSVSQYPGYSIEEE